MGFGLFAGGDGEHNSVGFVEISQKYLRSETQFSSEQSHLTKFTAHEVL